MIKLVVFDWNGVLIADTMACMAADNHILETFGGISVDLKTYRNTIIIPAIDFYTLHGCDREQLLRESGRLGKEFHSFYEPRAARVRTRRGAQQLLSWLQKHHIKAVILSNHTVEGISFQLKRLQLEGFFSGLLANTALDSSMKKRNKKEKLIDYFRKSGLQASEVLIIGDSPEEVEMGKAIGITTVAITDGYYAKKRLVDSRPDHLITNLAALQHVIKTV